jgi:putative flippase GtrA
MFIFISIFGIYAFVAKLMQLIIGVFFNYNFSRLVVFKDKKIEK